MVPLCIGLAIFLTQLKNLSGQATVIQPPTSSNSTNEYYVTGINGDFQFDIINCGTNIACHITCAQENSCFQLSVHASLSNTLSIICDGYQSCKQLSVIGPSTSVNIECKGGNLACTNAQINVALTTNVNIVCNYSVTLSSNSPCNVLFINASHSSGLVNIKCLGGYSCYNSDIYVDYASYVNINTEGDYAMQYSNIYGYYVINQLDINCASYYGCANTNLYANYINGIVTVNCDADYAC
eukprot:419239_1